MMYVWPNNTYGIYDIQCFERNTGCLSDSDCHLGGAGSVCYAYGPGAFDQEKIERTDPVKYRTIVRGTQSGGSSDGKFEYIKHILRI